MIKAQVSAATATGDTVKTLIDTITVPKNAKMIVGIWAHALAGAGGTTLENITGIFELESVDINLQPLQLPLDCVALVGTGMAAISPRIFPANIPVNGGERIVGYVTMDLAQTVAGKARFGLIYEAT
jgi:hypothetical protein